MTVIQNLIGDSNAETQQTTAFPPSYVPTGFEMTIGREPIVARVSYDTSGNEITPSVMGYFDENGDFNMADSTQFTPTQLGASTDTSDVFATNTDQAHADFGKVYALKQVDTLVDGVIDPAQTTYWDTGVFPNVDVTLIAGAAPYVLGPKPKRVLMGAENIAVSGGTVSTLAAIPTNAGYARIHIEDSNVRYTTDGTAPANSHGTRVADGGFIEVERDELSALQIVAVDGAGDIDAGATALLTVNYANIASDED